MTDFDNLCTAIERGDCSAFLALADWLEENGRAAVGENLRAFATPGARNCSLHPARVMDLTVPRFGFRRDVPGDRNIMADLPPAIWDAIDAPWCMPDGRPWKLFDRPALAYLALAAALAQEVTK